MSAAAGFFTPAEVRDALVAGPTGQTQVGCAEILLLEWAGLLAHQGVVCRCIDVEVSTTPGDPWAVITGAELDLCELQGCLLQSCVPLTGRQVRLVRVLLDLVDLHADLVELEQADQTTAVAAVLAALGLGGPVPVPAHDGAQGDVVLPQLVRAITGGAR